MIPEQWRLGLVLAAVAANLLFVAALYAAGGRRWRPGVAPGDDHPHPDRSDAAAGHVTCPDCGCDNESGYRYCRACVAELPAVAGFDGGADDPLGRLT
jgi:hypothetical protein